MASRRYHKQTLIRRLAEAILNDPASTPKQKVAALRAVQRLPEKKASKPDASAPEKESELDSLLRGARKSTVGQA